MEFFQSVTRVGTETVIDCRRERKKSVIRPCQETIKRPLLRTLQSHDPILRFQAKILLVYADQLGIV